MRPTIRDAGPFDIPAILEMLRQYREFAPLGFLQKLTNELYITQVLAEIMAGRGIALVAETDKIDGMLLAAIAPSAWSAKHLVMTEMAYWINVEARGGSAAHRLIATYVERGKTLKTQGRIEAFFVSKMANSPDLKYGRFGFTKLEEFWVI